MRKLVLIGIRMIALSWPLSLAEICGVTPGWTGIIAKLLLIGGVVNFIIGEAFEVRRTLRNRAELKLEQPARGVRGRFPVGIREDGELVWVTPGAISGSAVFSDHRWHAAPGMAAEKTLATTPPEPALEARPVTARCIPYPFGLTVTGTIVNHAGQVVGYVRPQHASGDWVSPREYYLKHGISLVEVEADDHARAVIRESPREYWPMAGERGAWVVPLLTGDLQHGVRFSAPGDLIKGLSSLGDAIRAGMTRMPHGPECDCSECD